MAGKWRLKIGDTEYSGEAVDRLAAYENPGLELGDIIELKARDGGAGKNEQVQSV